MQKLSRREALRGGGVAALAAGAAVIPFAAVAGGEDAELVNLWEEWKAQNLRVRDTYLVMEEIDSKVADPGGPCWDLAKFATDGKHGHFRVIFISSWHHDDSTKTVRFKAATGNSRERARQIEDSLRAERDKKRKAAERKFGLPAAKRKHDEAHAQRTRIEERIAATPAQGLQGIAVQLALWTHYSESHDIDEPEGGAIGSVCKTVTKLTGFDIAAKDANW